MVFNPSTSIRSVDTMCSASWEKSASRLSMAFLMLEETEWPIEVSDEEIKELFTHIHPKDIHNYFLDSEDVARDCDSYYDGLREERFRQWHNVLKMQIPEELREKYGL